MDEEKTRAEVAHIEFISYGTSRIFDRRMRSLDWKRKVVTFLGVCCGQLKLATALEFFQYRFSDSFGGNPPLYSCGLSAL